MTKCHVRYFPSRGTAYCPSNSEQHKLAVGPDDGPTGPTFLEALKAYHEVHRFAAIGTAGDTNTVRDLRSPSGGRGEGKVIADRTFRQRTDACRTLCDRYGELSCRELRLSHLEAIINDRRKPRTVKSGYGNKATRQLVWGPSSVRNFPLARAYSVGGRRDFPKSPLATVELGAVHSSAREHVLTDADHGVIAAACSQPRYRPLRFILKPWPTPAPPRVVVGLPW